jgi:hypothetical protein
MNEPQPPSRPQPLAGPEPASSPLAARAEQWNWQRQAARALAGILDAHPGMPPATWTITAAGYLTANINGLDMPASEVRAAYTAWHHALDLGQVTEEPIHGTGITSLSSRGTHGTVPLALITRTYPPAPDDGEPAGQQPEPHATNATTAQHASRARQAGFPAARQQLSAPTNQPGDPQARPQRPPRPSGGPQLRPGL